MKTQTKPKSKFRGFYTALALSLVMIGAACVFAYRQTSQTLEQNLNSLSEQMEVTTTATLPYEAPVVGVQTDVAMETETTVTATSATEETAAPETTPETTAPETEPEETPMHQLTPPLSDFSILNPFSDGELVKSETTGTWQTHNGVDLSCAAGSDVFAIDTGTVSEVCSDALWGYTVTIDHDNGITSRYKELSNTQIRSTIDGMILDVPIKVGNSVIQANTFNDGTTIASVADMSNMLFRGNVDETDVGKLHEGMPVKLTIGALQNVELDANLEYVSPKATEDNGVIMFEVKAAVKIPADVFVRAGYSANASIVIESREGVLTLPESTVEFEGEKTYVYLLTSAEDIAEQTFDKREVKIGLSDGINIELTEGVTADDKVRGAKEDKKK